MHEAGSWREVLGGLIQDRRERLRVADALGVHPLTLRRWIKGISTPPLRTISPLPDIFPLYRQQLISLIAQSYPAYTPHEHVAEEDILTNIPSAVYTLVFDTHITSPPHLRKWVICQLVVEQLLKHLDPHQRGLAVTIAECVHPPAGEKVRSLRVTYGKGTAIWQEYIGKNTQFLGAESRIGKVVLTGRPVVVHNAGQQARMFPGHNPPAAQSAATFPLLQADRIAGCMGIFNAQQQYFTPSRLEVIERYVELLTIAFEPEAFYSLDQIELKIMPPCEKQFPLFAEFQQRVTQRIALASAKQELLARPQAEEQVWQEIEEILLQLASQPESASSFQWEGAGTP